MEQTIPVCSSNVPGEGSQQLSKEEQSDSKRAAGQLLSPKATKKAPKREDNRSPYINTCVHFEEIKEPDHADAKEYFTSGSEP